MPLKGVFLPLGYSCNNNCIHCFLPFADNPTNKTTEDAKKRIKQAAEYGIDRISLTGGEPTIRKDIFELISFCRDLNIEIIQLQTNGRMLSYKPFCRKLFASGLNEVCISFHGHTAQIQDRITRVNGSFEQTLKGIKNLFDVIKGTLPKEALFPNIVVSSHNCRHLPDIIRFFSGLGFPLIEIEYPRLMGNAWRFKNDIPSRKEAALYMKSAAEVARQIGTELFIDDFPVCLSDGFYDFNAYTRHGNDQIELDLSSTEMRDTEKTDKLHSDKCNSCHAKGFCPGEWPENAKNFGWDSFRALSSIDVNNINRSSGAKA